MNKHKLILTGVIITATLGSSIAFSSGTFLEQDAPLMLAKLDAEEARELKKTGEIMALESLIAQVRKDYPGQIIEIELDEEDDRYIYEIEVVNDDGVVIELEIDAASGEVLKYKKDY